MKARVASMVLVGSVVAACAQDWSAVLPELKSLPAPAVIREGVRLSYYGSAGDLPNEEADKWDAAADGWNYATAPSGHGYTQVDVIGISDGWAALNVQAWLYSNWSGPLIPVRGGQRGFIGYAGGGDWWIHPQVLAGLEGVSTGDFAVFRTVQVIDGVAHAAIRIQRTTPESRQATVYDLATGLLLFKNAAVKTGNTTYASQMYFKGTRQLPNLGGGRSVPLWLRTGLTWDYEGLYRSQVMGGPPFDLPLSAAVEIRTVGARWFGYRQTTTLWLGGGLPPQVETVDLVGGGTLYVDPEVLKTLVPDTVLDTDPITGAKLSVVTTGTRVTLLAVASEQSVTELTYDVATGLMIRFRSWDSTDPIYYLASDLASGRLPDMTVPPTLAVRRQGNALLFSSPGATGFTLEKSTNGGRTWTTSSAMTEGVEVAVDPGVECVWFRLRR